jgi:hypothetical protein
MIPSARQAERLGVLEATVPAYAISWSARESRVSALPDHSGGAVSPWRWSHGNVPGRTPGRIYPPGIAARALRALPAHTSREHVLGR